MNESAAGRCPICLDTINGEAYLDLCFHQFCYHCILQWTEALSGRKGSSLLECPLCKSHFNSIIHDFDGKNFQRHYVKNGSSDSRAFQSAAHARRAEVYHRGGNVVVPVGYGDNSKWLRCWLQRELQALMQDDDVDLVIHHVLGNLEFLRKSVSGKKKVLPSFSSLARDQNLDLDAISAAVKPFVFDDASKFAQELQAFLASGLSIAAYDNLAAPPEDAGPSTDPRLDLLLPEDSDYRSDVEMADDGLPSEDDMNQPTASRYDTHCELSECRKQQPERGTGSQRRREQPESSEEPSRKRQRTGDIEGPSTEAEPLEATLCRETDKAAAETDNKAADRQLSLEAQLRARALENFRRHFEGNKQAVATEEATKPSHGKQGRQGTQQAEVEKHHKHQQEKHRGEAHQAQSQAEKCELKPDKKSATDENRYTTKTFCVSRGGEQVQVGCKVYIPPQRANKIRIRRDL